jgi:hypothetical protein
MVSVSALAFAEFSFDVPGRLPLYRYFVYSFASVAVGIVYSIPHGPVTVIQWVFFAFSVMGCTAAYGAAAGLVFRPAHQSLSLVANSNRALSRMVRRERARLDKCILAGQPGDYEPWAPTSESDNASARPGSSPGPEADHHDGGGGAGAAQAAASLSQSPTPTLAIRTVGLFPFCDSGPLGPSHSAREIGTACPMPRMGTSRT